jgi:DNA-binding NtrC family response regulator
VSRRLLVVEDRDSLRKMYERALGRAGYVVSSAEDLSAARRQLAGPAFDLVLTDLRLPDGSGLEVVRAARERSPQTPVVVLTGFGSVESAVQAMKLGAVDFLEKPVELPNLLAVVEQLLAGTLAPGDGSGAGGPAPLAANPEGGANTAAPASILPGGAADGRWVIPGGPTLVGVSVGFRAARRLTERVAAKNTTVLLTGESGTGKELFARALHALSPRREGPFVAINCAAIPEPLLENELFGHEKGAFTGADRRQAGRFEMAHHGTLFLDEIGELAPSVQGKVLRVLEERCFERVGGGATVRVDVRLVAATNRQLEEMVAAGTFRGDLFFRLNVFPIELPPLRERGEDFEILVPHLLGELARRHQVERPELAGDALALLRTQPWPGNIRELGNVLERLVILYEGRRVGAGELLPLLAGRQSGPPQGSDPAEQVRAALLAAQGDKERAAASLGISYRTLQRRIKELDLEGYPKYRS